MKRAFLILSILFLAGASAVHAQSVEPLTVTLSPEHPRPYGTVTVTPASSLIDLAGSTVTISANGAVIEKGSGAQPADIQLGGPGSRTTIVVTAVLNGQTFQKQVVVRPSDVSLIIEPVSSTHPFYRGSSLITSEGRVRLVALADLRTSSGALIPSSSLIYTWKSADQILQEASGIGKSVLTVDAPFRYRDASVSVTVTSQDGSAVAQASTVIAAIDPIVRIYRNDPLLGPWFSLALPASFSMTDEEETFRAVPYFFSGTPSLSWQVNGTPSETAQDLTVRPAGNGTGTAVISVTASDTTRTQSATRSLSVTFGGSKSTGIFGL